MTTFTIAVLTGIISFAIGVYVGVYYSAKALASGKVKNVKVTYTG